VVIPYVKGISEKFKRIGNRYNIKTIFKIKHILRDTLLIFGPLSDPQQTAHCIYSIPCECGRSYIGEIGRPLAVLIRERRHNLKKNSFIEKSKLFQLAFEEDRQVAWNEAKVSHIASNSRYRKYK
jgi:hypothetical protein